MSNAPTRYVQWLTQHPWPAILITLPVIFADAGGGRDLAFETDSKVFLSKDNPRLPAYFDVA